MLKALQAKEKVAGVKQSKRAIREDLAKEVFLAADADPALITPLARLCEEKGVPVHGEFTMRQLGQAAGIQVGAAVVTLLK